MVIVVHIDAENFVSSVKPLLESKDLPGLLAHLKKHWTPDQITSFLSCRCGDARKVAALALSLVGGQCCIPHVAKRLRESDPMTNQMAEHALWCIWFRLGSPEANHQLARGALAIERKDYEHAVRHFDRAIQLSPDFSEAYNQRAIAHYLTEQFDQSLRDCQKTVELMPCHFGAWAGLGHCHAHEGRHIEAIESYRRALEINPHLECIAESIEELERKAKEGSI